MATITERRTENGGVRYQAKVRLKGYPPQAATFLRKRRVDLRPVAAGYKGASRPLLFPEVRCLRTGMAGDHLGGGRLLPRRPVGTSAGRDTLSASQRAPRSQSYVL